MHPSAHPLPGQMRTAHSAGTVLGDRDAVVHETASEGASGGLSPGSRRFPTDSSISWLHPDLKWMPTPPKAAQWPQVTFGEEYWVETWPARVVGRHTRPPQCPRSVDNGNGLVSHSEDWEEGPREGRAVGMQHRARGWVVEQQLLGLQVQ